MVKRPSRSRTAAAWLSRPFLVFWHSANIFQALQFRGIRLTVPTWYALFIQPTYLTECWFGPIWPLQYSNARTTKWSLGLPHAFTYSFSGHPVCARDNPGGKWTEALIEAAHQYGKDYTDVLLTYALKIQMPPKYVDNFDRYFRFKLYSGESVAGVTDSGSGLNSIFQRHEIDVSQP